MIFISRLHITCRLLNKRNLYQTCSDSKINIQNSTYHSYGNIYKTESKVFWT